MEYTEFFFRNFKGIGEMTLPLSGGRVTTLIGLNESGKTTILEAIFCFSYGAENLDAIDPSMASLREPEQWVPIALRANFNDTITIGATVRLSAGDKDALRRHMLKSHKVKLTSIPETVRISENYVFENSRFDKVASTKNWDLKIAGTSGQQRNPRTFGGKSEEWAEALRFLKARLPRIWYFPNFLFELPSRFVLDSSENAPPSEEHDKSAFYRSTFEEILGHLGHGANLDTHVVERVRSDDNVDKRSLGSLLLEMSREITRTVFEGWNRIFGRAPLAQEVELQAHEDSDGAIFLEMKIKGPDGYYDLSERSLGFRWFFMFLLMTSYRAVAEDQNRVVLLLDEPASNLHSSAQAELLKSFENLAQSCDLIYTTHSHHMINLRWLDGAYVVKNAALEGFEEYFTSHLASKTAVSATPYRRFVSEHPDQTSYFQPVLDLLDYQPSSLEPVPEVVLVEGKSDFLLLRYVRDVLGLDCALALVPGGGAGSLDPLIRLHLGWGKSFIILLDGDAEGRRQKQRYEEEFGPFVTDRCLLLPELVDDTTVKEIEHLLSEADKTATLDAVFGPEIPRPPEKKALRQALTELFARGEAVEFEGPTLEGFKRVLSGLERRLVDMQSQV